ncbi:hypothetical protein BU16DRAFT_539932 [Lophium mytilinum]|uniref:Uncharacterized protein n=1 Tax=Lophium mytilinum TaxID=390894 RepID=A0A6A6QR79_9PEZI|nr:hypothetical protein BU16DRAFT_539932 [Lophium mytilinum]
MACHCIEMISRRYVLKSSNGALRSITHRATRAHGESDDECRLITISLKEGRDILDNTHMSMDGYTNGQNSPYVGQRRIWGPHNDDENGEWPAPGTRIHHTEDRTFNITEFEDQRVWVPEEDDDDDPGYSIVGAASRGGQIRGAASRHGQSH